MTKLFLIRHAESEGNLYRRSHGHYNGLVTKRGNEQIIQLGKRFENEKIDAVYSSDLLRACVTAAAIAQPRGLEIRTDTRLREVDIGAWEDMPWGNIEFDESEMCEYFNSDPEKWHVEGSEAYSSVLERMTECIAEIAASHDGETVAVFSHGFAIRTFLSGVLGVASRDTPKVPYCDNTAVALLRYENGELSVEYHGDNSHLHDENSTFAQQSWWRGEGQRKQENLRYLPFDGARDKQILEQCRAEVSSVLKADAVFTAFLDDKPVGFLGLRTDESEENAGWIYHLYVVPEQRRKGLALQMLGQAQSVYRKLGRDKLRILAPEDGEMARIYQKYGFTGLCENIMEKDI